MRSFIKLSLISVITISTCSSCSDNNEAWAKYSSKEGAFSVNMPGNIKRLDKTLPTPFGKQVIHYFTWKPSSFSIDKFKLFQVSYTDCPSRAERDTAILRSALDSSIGLRKKDFTETEIVSEPIEFNGYPGRSFIYDLNNSITIVKECIVNNRVYDLTVICKKNYATNIEINNFFNSFQSFK